MSSQVLMWIFHCRPPSTCPEAWGEGGEPDPSDEEIWDAMYGKAEDLKALAAKYGLQILMLQPLNQFEGWDEGSSRDEWAKRKAQKWLTLCSKLGVEQIQVSLVVPCLQELRIANIHLMSGWL